MQSEPLLTGRNNQLPGRLWFDREPPRAVIIVVHGLGDHSGRYEPFATHAVAANVAVLAFDLPGHGLAPGRRGHVERYSDLIADIHAVRASVAKRFPAVPQFLLGHSMGGNLAINYVLRHPALDNSASGVLQGLVLAAAMLLPPHPPARPQIIAAWITGHLIPWLTFRRPPTTKTTPPHSEISHSVAPESDATSLASTQAPQRDPLLHSEISIYLATQLLAQGRWALDQARRVDVPTLVIDCEDDHEIDRAASENVAIRIGPHATHIVLPSGGHNLLHDPDASSAIDSVVQWVVQHS